MLTGFLSADTDTEGAACQQRSNQGGAEAWQDDYYRASPHLADLDGRGVD